MLPLQNRSKRLLVIIICTIFIISSCTSSTDEALPTFSLSPQALVNLEAFTKLVGYVQYFHPSDSARKTDWESFTVQGVIFVEEAQSCLELENKLIQIFQPIAPTIRIFQSEHPLPPFYQAIPNEVGNLEIVYWKYHGFGGGTPQEIYYKELIFKPLVLDTASVMGDPRSPYAVDLGCDLTALIPLSLYTDKVGTLPHQSSTPYISPTLPSPASIQRAERIATVVLSWNILQHFYPYHNSTTNDWLSALRMALIGADTAKHDAEFAVVLQEMLASLKDGHARVYTEFPPSTDIYRPAFGWDWVDDQLLITFVDKELNNVLRPGDRVIKIDDQSILDVIKTQQGLISGATDQWIMFRTLQNILTGPLNSTLSLTVQTPMGIISTNSYTRTEYIGLNPFLFTEQRPAVISNFKDNLWYIDLTRITETQFRSSLPDLENATGIIFDLRGYPFLITPDFLGHLIDQEAEWPLLRIPILTVPDTQLISYEEIRQTIEPQLPRLTSNVVFVIDGRVISYAESLIQTIKFNDIGTIVGTPTAGTNGNIAVFTLFEKYTFQFTGMQVLNPDGSPHYGIGVHPDILISRTRFGVRLEQDELLLGAIRTVTP